MNLTHSLLKHFLVSLVFLFLAGCSSRSAIAPHDQTLGESSCTKKLSASPNSQGYFDPLEGINRSIWRLNYEFLDPLLLRPMAIAWCDCIPHPVRRGVGNTLSNLEELPNAINYLLIGNFSQSLKQIARFLINTVVGFGGLLDVAAQANLPRRSHHSLDHVLGYYQLGTGPYWVLPVYGPLTPRQFVAKISEQLYYFPLSLLTFWGSVGKEFLQKLEERAQFLDHELVLRQSNDSYLTMREIYFQRLQFSLRENQPDSQGLPEEEEILSPEAIEQLD